MKRQRYVVAFPNYYAAFGLPTVLEVSARSEGEATEKAQAEMERLTKERGNATDLR